MRGKKVVLVGVALVFLMSHLCFAENADSRDDIQQLLYRIEALEKKVAEQDACIKTQNKDIQMQQQKISEYEVRLGKLDEQLPAPLNLCLPSVADLEIGVGATLIVQGTNNVNNTAADAQKKVSRTDAAYSADITIGKEFTGAGGKAFLHLEAGQGDGLEDNLTLYSNVNRDADSESRVHLTELWYEQSLFDGRSTVVMGKLDPTAYFDNNAAANCEATQFLGRIFRNSPVIEIPDNPAGIRFSYMPQEWWELGYGFFDGNSDWERLGKRLFNIGQVVFKPRLFGLPGNYRFLSWRNNADHTEWLDTERTKEAGYGFGLSFDQKLSEIITAFCRYGWQNPQVYNPDITATGDAAYSLEQSWSAGLQIEGKSWGREQDVFALAVGQIFPSSDYKKAGASLEPARKASAEGHLEMYYRIYMNEHLSVSPDFQYIWNPFGEDVADDSRGIFVGGMRAQTDF